MAVAQPPAFPELEAILSHQPIQEKGPSLVDILCGPVTMDDLEALLRSLSPRIAPGVDNVNYAMLREAPPRARRILLEGIKLLLTPEGHRREAGTISHQLKLSMMITLLEKDASNFEGH